MTTAAASSAPAFSRVEFGVVARAVRGGNAVKCSAYNAASSFKHGDVVFDFSRKRGEHQAHAVLLPPGAPSTYASAAALWSAAEAAERRCDAQTARQILVSIPREIPADDRLAYTTAICAPWVADGAACQIDVHCPTAADGGEQPHAHLLLTFRRVTDKGFAKTKSREWNTAFREQDGRSERARIEQRSNAWIAAHGINARIDLRSFADRGVDRAPEPQARRADWQRWRREGGDPDQAPTSVARVLAHRALRTEADAAEREVTRTAEVIAKLERIAAIPLPKERIPQRRIPPRIPTSTTRTPTATAVIQADRILPAAAGIAPEDRAVGDARRARMIATMLRRHYDTRWLPPSVADRLVRVSLDRRAGMATLHLADSSRLVDSGDRITVHGALTAATVAEVTEAAARHGWTTVCITGNKAFRAAVAEALALRRPPIECDQMLSQEAVERVQAAVQARARAAALALERRVEGDPTKLQSARRIPAAILDGNQGAIDSMDGGDPNAASRAAREWEQRRDEARSQARRQAEEEARRCQAQPNGPKIPGWR